VFESEIPHIRNHVTIIQKKSAILGNVSLVVSEDQIGIVDIPRGDGHIDPRQKFGEHPLSVETEMVDGEKKVGFESKDVSNQRF
jgi:hypothetical protein